MAKARADSLLALPPGEDSHSLEPSLYPNPRLGGSNPADMPT